MTTVGVVAIAAGATICWLPLMRALARRVTHRDTAATEARLAAAENELALLRAAQRGDRSLVAGAHEEVASVRLPNGIAAD